MRPQRKVGARELKTRLGKYIQAARDGETITITERGKAVAELRPLPRVETGTEAHLNELERTGVLTRGAGGRLPAFRPIRTTGRPVSEALLEDRDDRL